MKFACFFLMGAAAALPPQKPVQGVHKQAGPLLLSKQGYEMVVDYETGGKAYYVKRLARATWPKGASGVTVGVGYDLGYNTRAQIAADWSGVVSADAVRRMQAVAGLKGQAARLALGRVSGVVVTWEQGLRVFDSKTLPRFGADTARIFPRITDGHAHGQSALLSLVFNRGSSLSGSGRSEMRAIAAHTAAGRWRSVPVELRKMKRLWQGRGLDGLLRRREDEARLVEAGLRMQSLQK